MFYNETPSASGQTLTFDVNPQPGDVIQFVSPVTNSSTETYTAVFSTGESFPIMYGGEELVQAYLLYSGQTYLAVFTGNGLEVTAQQAADAEGNTVNTAPYVINTFLDPAYSGLLTEQMQALASLVGDGTKLTGNFTVPVTMSTGLSVTGDVSVSSGILAVTGTASAAAGTSGTELVNYTQMTDGSLSPTLDSIQVNGFAQLNSNWTYGDGIVIGSNPGGAAGLSVNAPSGYGAWLERLTVDGAVMWFVNASGDAVATGEITASSANITGDQTIGGNLAVSGTASAAAGTYGNELVNYTQMTNGSLSPTFGNITTTTQTTTSNQDVGGNLNVSGTASAAAGTAGNDLVNLGQFAAIYSTGGQSQTVGGNNTTSTSVSFTAPCNGWCFFVGSRNNSVVASQGGQVSLSFNGNVVLGDNTETSTTHMGSAYVTSGEVCTATYTGTSAVTFSLNVGMIFIPDTATSI